MTMGLDPVNVLAPPLPAPPTLEESTTTRLEKELMWRRWSGLTITTLSHLSTISIEAEVDRRKVREFRAKRLAMLRESKKWNVQVDLLVDRGKAGPGRYALSDFLEPREVHRIRLEVARIVAEATR